MGFQLGKHDCLAAPDPGMVAGDLAVFVMAVSTDKPWFTCPWICTGAKRVESWQAASMLSNPLDVIPLPTANTDCAV